MNKTIDILLVYPDFRSSDVFSNPGLPVGLGFVARSLENVGFRYEIIDLNIDTKEYLMDRVSKLNPQFLGISMLSYRCKESYNLLNDLKYHWPQLKIISGGPHITANREVVLEECPAIDVGVVGEGDIAIVEILRGESVKSIKGLIFREEEDVIFSGERAFIDNLDNLPFPTYDGFKLEKYGKKMPLHSSRGCPYRCIFCGAPRILGKKWRRRSAQSMVEEVKYWYGKEYRHFVFNDSNFAVDKARVASFCNGIIESDLHVCFEADGLRADHVDRKILEKMRCAGFTNLTFGVESGSDRILQNLKKDEKREDIEKAIEASTDLGFIVSLFFLIGSPGEDGVDIKQSFDLARKYNVERVYFFNLMPIPGTEFYNWAVERGIIDGSETKYPEENFGFSNKAFLQTDVMTIDQLSRYIRIARRIEKQIRIKYAINENLSKSKVKRLLFKGNIINSLSWFISHPLITPIFMSAWHVVAIFRRAIRKAIQKQYRMSQQVII